MPARCAVVGPGKVGSGRSAMSWRQFTVQVICHSELLVSLPVFVVQGRLVNSIVRSASLCHGTTCLLIPLLPRIVPRQRGSLTICAVHSAPALSARPARQLESSSPRRQFRRSSRARTSWTSCCGTIPSSLSLTLRCACCVALSHCVLVQSCITFLRNKSLCFAQLRVICQSTQRCSSTGSSYDA